MSAEAPRMDLERIAVRRGRFPWSAVASRRDDQA